MQGPRLPTSKQWLGWAAGKLRVDFDRFKGRCDLLALETGLDHARSVKSSGDPRWDTAKTLAAVLLWQSVKPPFPPERRSLTVETIELVARMSGYELSLRQQQRAVLSDRAAAAFDGKHRSPRKMEQIADWLSPRLRQLRSEEVARANRQIESLLGPAPTPRPSIFVSQPVSLLDEGDRADLHDAVAKIRPQCIAVVKELLDREQAPGAPIDPVMGPVRVETPTSDHHWEDDDVANCTRNRPLILSANAFVILGFEGGSHSTGFEHALIPSGIPVLYVAWHQDCLPAAIRGGLPPEAVEVNWVDDTEEVPAVVAAFVQRNWPKILRSWHGTELRELIYGQTARRIKARLDQINPERLNRLLRRSGFRPDSLSLLTTADGLAVTGAETIQRMTAALGLRVDDPLRGPPPVHLSTPQLDALDQFGREYEVPLEELEDLREVAEHQMQVGVMRLSLRSIREWLEFQRQIREAGWQ